MVFQDLIDTAAAANEDVDGLLQCAVSMQEHNMKLKDFIAELDAKTAHEAMCGGLTGFGCDDPKLIAALCSRTKSQLRRTAGKFRELFDKDLRATVRSEAGGSYGRMMNYALAPPEDYVADMIDLACSGLGCNETVLIELLVTQSKENMAAGKEAWEGRTDKHLFDYLDSELGSEYSDLQNLLFTLLKGERDDGDEVDEDAATTDAEVIHKECSKGMMGDFKEDKLIRKIVKKNQHQNAALCAAYEREYNKSMAGAISDRCNKTKFVFAIKALLIPKADFIAQRLEAAMKGFGTDEIILVRLLGGLDSKDMSDVCEAYERKYGRTLKAALKEEIDGRFQLAALRWIDAQCDSAAGTSHVTEAPIEADEGAEESDSLGRFQELVKALILEHESLMKMVAILDAQRIAEACGNFGTDDKKLIDILCSRSKKHLVNVGLEYRTSQGDHDKDLFQLVSSQLRGWYKYLAQFIVLDEEHSDVRLLDLALDGLGADGAALIEFLCARSPARVLRAKKAWEARHDASLVDRFGSELHGDMKKLGLTMLQGKRLEDSEANGEGGEEPEVNEEAVDEAAQQLYDAGEAIVGTDEQVFIDLLCNNPPSFNVAVATAYENKFEHSLHKAITSEFSGNLKNALLALLTGDVKEWYAARLHQSFKGLGTGDRTVCRIIGSHDKKDARAIAEAYESKYGKTLAEAISAECSGNYKRLAIGWFSMEDRLDMTLPGDGEVWEVPEMDEEASDVIEELPPPPPMPESDEEDDEAEAQAAAEAAAAAAALDEEAAAAAAAEAEAARLAEEEAAAAAAAAELEEARALAAAEAAAAAEAEAEAQAAQEAAEEAARLAEEEAAAREEEEEAEAAAAREALAAALAEAKAAAEEARAAAEAARAREAAENEEPSDDEDDDDDDDVDIPPKGHPKYKKQVRKLKMKYKKCKILGKNKKAKYFRQKIKALGEDAD
jgi:hypothetical protein